MKFGVEHDVLAEAVAWVARALPSRPVVPVLSGMRLEAGDGLALSCFDYELAAATTVPAEVSEPGTALVPGRLLAEITRSLPGQPAAVSTDGDEVTLVCGGAEFTLVSLPLAEYPALPPTPPLAGTVDGGEFAAAIAQVLPAASRDDTLPMLTAVCLDIRGATMTLAATDRYRLAVRTLPWQPEDPQMRAIALVPARTLADAARIMTAGAAVSLAFPAAEGQDGGSRRAGASRAGDPRPAEGMITFESGHRRLTARLLAGEFIRYESRFPAEFGCVADLPAAAFIEAVRRVSLVADRATPVRLTFTPGKVTVEAHTEGRARASETLAASFHGEEPVISFNPHYLLDGLTTAAAGPGGTPPGGQRGHGEAAGAGEGEGAGETQGERPPAAVRLEFSSPARPALITPGEPEARDVPGTQPPPAFRYLVVPLRPPARA
jgi:DNA polymerase III subunit beta